MRARNTLSRSWRRSAQHADAIAEPIVRQDHDTQQTISIEPLAHYWASPDGTIRKANLAFVQLIGVPSEPEVIGTRISDYCEYLGDQDQLQQLLRRNRELESALFPICGVDGRRKWVRLTIRSVRNSLGRVVDQEGFLHDVTEWKHASDAAGSANARCDALSRVLATLAALEEDVATSLAHLEQALADLTGMPCFILLRRPNDSPNTLCMKQEAFQGKGSATPPLREALRPWIESCIQSNHCIYVPRSQDSHRPTNTAACRPPKNGKQQTLILPISGSTVPFGVLIIRQIRAPYVLPDADAQLTALISRCLGYALESHQARELANQEQQRLTHLLHSITEIREDERACLARELHDGIGQALAGLEFLIARLRIAIAPTPESPISSALRECEVITSDAHEEIRNLSHGLRPSVLDDLGLAAALRWYLATASRRLGIAAQIEITGIDKTRLPHDVETMLYRLTQEGMANAARHGHASRVEVRVVRVGHRVIWSLRDNGSGFDTRFLARTPIPGQGIGLLDMRERAELLGGKFQVRSSPDEGTALLATIPLPKGDLDASSAHDKHRAHYSRSALGEGEGS